MKAELVPLIGIDQVGIQLARARPLLDTLGASVTHMGNPGAGQATKVVNQAIVGVGFALMTEAVLLAEALGLDTSLVPRALAGGLADGAMLQRIFPAIAARDFTPPLGYVRQLAKDLKAVHHTSTALGCALPLVENATLRFSAYADDGGAQADSRSLILREGPADRSR